MFKRFAPILAAICALGLFGAAAQAETTGPRWVITSASDPTNIAPNSPSTEVQDIAIDATGGTFTLRTGILGGNGATGPVSTAPIPYDASPAEVQAAIKAVSDVASLVVVSGAPGAYVVTWPADKSLSQAIAGKAAAPVTADGSGLTLPGECVGGTPNSCQGSATVSLASRGESPPQLVLTAINVGGGSTDGAPVTVSDTLLPAGFTATGVVGLDTYHPASDVGAAGEIIKCADQPVVECKFSGVPIDPGDSLFVIVTLAVEGPPTVIEGESVVNRASVSGGGAEQAFAAGPLTISSSPAAYGIVPGSLVSALSSTQAGAHANLTTAFTLNTGPIETPVADPKDVEFDAPVGLVGDAVGMPRCTQALVAQRICPEDTQVGIASLAVRISIIGTYINYGSSAAVYNIAPAPGEPAAFMFLAHGIPVRMDASVLSDGDYGVRVTVPNINNGGGSVSTSVTIWGVPSEHNGPGLDEALNEDNTGGTFGGPGGGPDEALLSNPTQCSEPLSATLLTDSWSEPGVFAEESTPSGTLSGCDALRFVTSVSMVPDTFQAGAPAGYAFDLKVDRSQDANPEGDVAPDVKDVSTTLPLGTVISPSAAQGLGACKNEPGVDPAVAENEFGLHYLHLASCADDSQVATVEITSPDLAEPFGGAVYLAEPECNPCSPRDAEDGKMVKLLLQAKGEGEGGVLVKTTGWLSVNQQTGQLTATFENEPQLPFNDLKLTMDGGPRATLANPRVCGPATTSVDLTPWSTPFTADAIDTSTYEVTGCQPPQFSPSFTAGTTSSQAGGFSPFTLSFGRTDADQYLAAIQIKMPPGLLGSLANVPLCPEPQAAQGTCSAESEIGTSQVLTGPGAEPFLVTGGRVFLTGPYKGAPFGLSIVVPAKAGPYTLTGTTGTGSVVVRSTINIDPTTAALTVTSDPLPTILDGIPLQLKVVDVTISREHFMFNPTSCDKLQITGTLSSSEGSSTAVSSPFQATNCATLKFTPKFSVSTSGKTSKANGASLTATVSEPAGALGTQANISLVKVALPKQLPSRLTTLQKACTDKQFELNPANCPPESKIGYAVVHTPLLPVPLEGPAIFVSHGGEAFPSLTMVLQGYGVTIDLVGTTFISKSGVTSTTFKAVPDTPFNTFELTLPEGSYSALAANGNLCQQAGKLEMPTEFIAQNGAQITQATKIEVEGCSNTLSFTHKIKKKTLTLTVYAPAAGKITASGKGLTTNTKTAKEHEDLTITLKQKKAGKLKTTIKVTFTPSTGKDRTKQTKNAKLTFKK